MSPMSFVLTLAQTIPIASRRGHPFAVLLLTGAAAIVQLATGGPVTDFGAAGVLVAMYTVAAQSHQRLAILLAVMTPVGVLAAGVLDRGTPPHQLMLVLAEFAAAWVLGQIARFRRRRAAQAARIEREHEQRARQAAAVERRRMAGELHDALAHSLSLIAIEAGAARSIIDTAPERVRACLVSIETISAEAWAETREFLDRVDPEPEGAITLPRPGLHLLEDLIESSRTAGLSVDLVVSGDARPLTADTELCAYRVVQESLTNALKHARNGRTRVSVGYSRSHVDLEIVSEGLPPRSDRTQDGGGRGLRGMRERVRALGGQLSVGRSADRFSVRARLPVEPEAR